MSRTAMGVLSVIVVVCLLTASFVLWLNRSILDADSFSRVTVNVIEKPAVRDAVSAEIVDVIIKELPKDVDIPKNLIVGPARSLVSGILASPGFKPVLRNFAAQLDKAITANKPVAISLDTTEIKASAKPLVDTVNAQLSADISIDDLPDSMVVIEKGQIPSISGWSVFLLWLGPIMGVIGVVIIVAMLLSAAKEDKPRVLQTVGLVLLVGAVLFVALIGTMRSPLLASIDSSNVKTVAGGMFDAFTSSLAAQTWLLALAGLLMALGGYAWGRMVKPVAPAKRRPAARKKAA